MFARHNKRRQISKTNHSFKLLTLLSQKCGSQEEKGIDMQSGAEVVDLTGAEELFGGKNNAVYHTAPDFRTFYKG